MGQKMTVSKYKPPKGEERKGGFGKVWKVIYKKDHKTYALKEMQKVKVIDKHSIKSIKYERELLSRMKNPFIVNMHYSFQDYENLYLVIDLLNGGDLRYHISRHRRFSEEQTSLEYIHSKNVIHRDIKPENLVLDEKGYVKITDFGIAKVYNPNSNNSNETSGTPGYMAPEVMKGQNHNFSVDLFAIGVIGYEFMLGHRPYNGRSRKEIKDQMMNKEVQIKLSEIPNGWSEDAADFFNKLLIRKPDLRLGYKKGVAELKEHVWLKFFEWEELYNKNLEAPFIPERKENFDKKYCENIEKIGIETRIRYEKYRNDREYNFMFVNFTYYNISLGEEKTNQDKDDGAIIVNNTGSTSGINENEFINSERDNIINRSSSLKSYNLLEFSTNRLRRISNPNKSFNKINIISNSNFSSKHQKYQKTSKLSKNNNTSKNYQNLDIQKNKSSSCNKYENDNDQEHKNSKRKKYNSKYANYNRCNISYNKKYKNYQNRLTSKIILPTPQSNFASNNSISHLSGCASDMIRTKTPIAYRQYIPIEYSRLGSARKESGKRQPGKIHKSLSCSNFADYINKEKKNKFTSKMTSKKQKITNLSLIKNEINLSQKNSFTRDSLLSISQEKANISPICSQILSRIKTPKTLEDKYYKQKIYKKIRDKSPSTNNLKDNNADNDIKRSRSVNIKSKKSNNLTPKNKSKENDISLKNINNNSFKNNIIYNQNLINLNRYKRYLQKSSLKNDISNDSNIQIIIQEPHKIKGTIKFNPNLRNTNNRYQYIEYFNISNMRNLNKPSKNDNNKTNNIFVNSNTNNSNNSTNRSNKNKIKYNNVQYSYTKKIMEFGKRMTKSLTPCNRTNKVSQIYSNINSNDNDMNNLEESNDLTSTGILKQIRMVNKLNKSNNISNINSNLQRNIYRNKNKVKSKFSYEVEFNEDNNHLNNNKNIIKNNEIKTNGNTINIRGMRGNNININLIIKGNGNTTNFINNNNNLKIKNKNISNKDNNPLKNSYNNKKLHRSNSVNFLFENYNL